MSAWPIAKTLKAGLNGGPALVVHSDMLRGDVRVFRSASPWIYLVFGEGPTDGAAICETCSVGEPPPAIPKGNDRPLFEPGTHAYALFLLVWLHDFHARHARHEAEGQ